MNLKPNLWTLLFALAAAALVYVVTSNGSSAPATTDTQASSEASEVNPLVGDTINWHIAKARIEAYKQRVIPQIKKDHVSDSSGVVNADVRWFRLRQDEVKFMAESFDGEYVYAMMNIIGNTGKTDTVDVLFTNVAPKPDGTLLPGRYYDFTQPCPPLCDE